MKARSAAVLLLLAGMALPAHATEWMECTDPTGSLSLRMLLGAMDVIAVNTVEIKADGTRWSTAAEEGVTRITTGQAFETRDQMWIDMTDEAMNEVVARIRLFKGIDDGGEEGPGTVTGGVLEMPGIAAWAVHCTGP